MARKNMIAKMKSLAKLGRIDLFLAVLAFFIWAVTISSPAQAHAPGVVLSGLGSATIDGTVSPGEWENAGCLDLPVNVPEGDTTPGKVCAMNDSTNLYLLIQFARTVVDPGNTAAIEFANAHDAAVRVTGDDVLLINPAIGFFDEVRSTAPPCPPGGLCGFSDTSVGGTNDGAGAFNNDGSFTVYEFSHPLNSADDENDFSLAPGDTVGFTLFIRMIGAGAGFADTFFPTTCISCPNLFGDIVVASSVIRVAIDIKPGGFPNSINLRSAGVVPVAILSSSTFDATQVNPGTVTLAGAKVKLIGKGDRYSCSPQDVNGDGLADLVCHVMTAEFLIEPGDSIAVLEAETFDGQQIRGQDSIQIVPD